MLALADIVSLDARHAALAERREDEILDSWIFAAGRAVVDCVWRAGVKAAKLAAGALPPEKAAVAPQLIFNQRLDGWLTILFTVILCS